MSRTVADFDKKYRKRKNLEAMGWVSVPEIDFTGLNTWCQFTSRAVLEGSSRSVKDAFFTRPTALENQGVCDQRGVAEKCRSVAARGI